MHPAEQYASDVLNGKIIACDYVKKACMRYVRDMDRQGTKEFPFYFDRSAAQLFIDFAQICNHHKGELARTPIILEPWQQFIYWNLYGWKCADGTKRFRRSYIDMARKNAKTTMEALRALFHIALEGEQGAQVWVGATKEAQARILVNDAGKIAKSTPHLAKRFSYFTFKEDITRVVYPPTGSFIAPLGRDSKTQDGFDPSMGIMDEYHAHPNDSVVDIIESGMGARKQPTLNYITTAGYYKTYPCYATTRKNAISVLNQEIEDEYLFAIIFTLDDEEEWKDPAKWIKSNPNYGKSVNPDVLNIRFIDAMNKGGSKEVDFKTKNLNIWTDSAVTWIPADLWKSLKADITDDFLKGRECYAGLDLASTRDTTSLALLFPLEDGKIYVKNLFFIPKDTAQQRSKEDKIPYDQWIKDGWIIGTEGNVTDYNYIKHQYRIINEQYLIKSTGYDRYNATQLVIDLQDEGFILNPVSQAMTVISTPTKEFERLVYEGRLFHDGSPVMAWQIGNCVIKMDSSGNIKIDKEKSAFKVDGPYAAIDALAEWMTFRDDKVIEIPDDGLDFIDL